MDATQARLIITGTQPVLVDDVTRSLKEFVPITVEPFSRFTSGDKPAPLIMAYVMSSLDSKHRYNIALLKATGCRYLIVFAQHLTVPCMCELVRADVDDVTLIPCFIQDCIRLQDTLLPQLDCTGRDRHSAITPTEPGISLQNSINFEEIIQLVEEHFCAKLSLSRVANELNLSPSRISHLFKDICGLCFRQYLTCRRLEEAETLLNSPKSNITSVGFTLGFSSPSHFCRSFKEQFGITPKAYLEGCREFRLNNIFERYQNLRINVLPTIKAMSHQSISAVRAKFHRVA